MSPPLMGEIDYPTYSREGGMQPAELGATRVGMRCRKGMGMNTKKDDRLPAQSFLFHHMWNVVYSSWYRHWIGHGGQQKNRTTNTDEGAMFLLYRIEFP